MTDDVPEDIPDAVRLSFDAYVDLRLGSAVLDADQRDPVISRRVLPAPTQVPARPTAQIVAIAAVFIAAATLVGLAVHEVRDRASSSGPMPATSERPVQSTVRTTVGDFSFAHPAYLVWVPPARPPPGRRASPGTSPTHRPRTRAPAVDHTPTGSRR